MKNLRRLCATIVLTFALAMSALAEDGNTHTGSATPLPPPPPSASVELTASLADQTDLENSVANLVDPVTQIGMGLLQSMLSLF